MTKKCVRELLRLKARIDPNLVKTLDKSMEKPNVIHPSLIVRAHDYDKEFIKMTSRDIYDILVSTKIRMPTGLLNWCLEFELSDRQILTALTFASNCKASVFDRGFQYKIITNILPTNDYLKRYRIKDDDTDVSLLYCQKQHIIRFF